MHGHHLLPAMKPIALIASFVCVGVCVGAQAAPADAKKLARFDIGFTKCEARFAHMKGQADEAYLSLWRIKPDEKAKKDLAKLRKSAAYKKEQQSAAKTIGKAASDAAADQKISSQCQATWAEVQKNRK